MAKILYGVSGEGSGHSTRALVVAQHLLEQGHEVRLASYDRGYRNLAPKFDVLEIEGLTIGSENNKVSILKTIQENLTRLSSANRRLTSLRELFKSFEPHAVITDFEPMTAYLAHHYQLPLISLDNQQRMRYVRAPVPSGLEHEARMTRAVIRAMIPKPDVCLVTAFVRGQPLHERIYQFPPIIDPAVANRRGTVTGGSQAPILVYLTSGFDSLIRALADFPRERFRIYGCGSQEGLPVNDQLEFLPPSREGFLDDLCRCKAVIATAGFTLISEALYLGKPYLAFPMQGQYEQQLNAYQLDTAGWGRFGRSVQRESLAAFLYDLPEFSDALTGYERGDNHALLSKLDELLLDNAALALALRQTRKGNVRR
jgi:uncharacterized protein (TIGR00661 family)